MSNKHTKKKTSVHWLFALILAAVLGVAGIKYFDPVQTSLRWFLESGTYKARVISLPKPTDGYLKHVEWDGWGFAGAGSTVVYLVFDPTNLLYAAVKSETVARFSGLPCVVQNIEQVENQWYLVLFYTDTDWEHCPSFVDPHSTVVSDRDNSFKY